MEAATGLGVEAAMDLEEEAAMDLEEGEVTKTAEAAKTEAVVIGAGWREVAKQDLVTIEGMVVVVRSEEGRVRQ